MCLILACMIPERTLHLISGMTMKVREKGRGMACYLHRWIDEQLLSQEKKSIIINPTLFYSKSFEKNRVRTTNIIVLQLYYEIHGMVVTAQFPDFVSKQHFENYGRFSSVCGVRR